MNDPITWTVNRVPSDKYADVLEFTLSNAGADTAPVQVRVTPIDDLSVHRPTEIMKTNLGAGKTSILEFTFSSASKRYDVDVVTPGPTGRRHTLSIEK